MWRNYGGHCERGFTFDRHRARDRGRVVGGGAMNNLEAYDEVLRQMQKTVNLMHQNNAIMNGASPQVRAECMALHRDMSNSLRKLEASLPKKR